MVSAETRQRYTEEIAKNSKVSSTVLLRAFAKVPREEFVGEGPWKILSSRANGPAGQQVAEVLVPAELYRDVAVILDPSRNLTNGNPGTLAPWLEALNLAKGKSVFHLGCGTGYYTAIIAEAVEPAGQVTAFEVDPTLAAQARVNLARYSHVEVVEGDGGAADTGARDAILINAGVTHPRENWLDNLRPAGSLVVPLTVEFGMPHVGKGMVLHVSRLESEFAARFFPGPVMIYSCSSVRDSQLSSLLGQQFRLGTFTSVQSLRRDAHSPDPSCWLHTSGFCLSTRPLASN
jgi:protein-L-isoaspartate(D-aspartate) O-methyltransferase